MSSFQYNIFCRTINVNVMVNISGKWFWVTFKRFKVALPVPPQLSIAKFSLE